jgi:hypothetical protein
VVFRHKSPVAAVSTIVAVVTHHPVVIHLEGVLFADMNRLELIGISNALVEPVVILGDEDAVACARNIDGTVFVRSPIVVSERLNRSSVFRGLHFDI